jgi:hypothetical protein
VKAHHDITGAFPLSEHIGYRGQATDVFAGIPRQPLICLTRLNCSCRSQYGMLARVKDTLLPHNLPMSQVSIKADDK